MCLSAYLPGKANDLFRLLTPAVANVGDITETEKLLYSEEQVIFHQ